MFYINPNEFKHSVTFQRYTLIGKDDDGRPKYCWIDLYTTRAKILNVRGSEFTQAYGAGIKLEKTVYTRYNHSVMVSSEDRLVYDNVEYNIVYVNDVGNEKKWLEFKLERVR
jgi:SPP1 family predicted phage head-tail adaptor